MSTPLEALVNHLTALGQNLGVISTVSVTGKPESAVVYFSFDGEGNIYFVTRSGSRKYNNIARNPNVAFVVYSTNPPKTIQVEGVVETVDDAGEQAELFSDLVSLVNKNNPNPPIDQLGESEIKFLRLTTGWARTSNFEIERKGEMFEEVLKN